MESKYQKQFLLVTAHALCVLALLTSACQGSKGPLNMAGQTADGGIETPAPQDQPTSENQDDSDLANPLRDSCGFHLTKPGGVRVSWQSRAAIHLVLHDTLDQGAQDAVLAAAQIWNKSFNPWKIFVIDGVISHDPNPEATKKTLVWMRSKRNGLRPEHLKNASVGTEEDASTKTVYDADTGHIDHAPIALNGFDVRFSINGKPTRDQVDLISVLVHELGHVLGLDHTPRTVMASRLAKGRIRRDIEPQLIDLVNCEYARYPI